MTARSTSWARAARTAEPMADTAGGADMLILDDADPAFAVRLREDACAYCGAPTGGTVDHIEPRSAGGSNRVHNLTGACPICNGRKGSWSLLLFLLALHDAHKTEPPHRYQMPTVRELPRDRAP
jgi:hypothetical protein